jgi:hypothetical protein
MTLSEHCSYCKKYIKAYLKNDPEGFDQKRIEKGFWASVKEVNDEQWLLNNIFNVEEAIKMRMPVHIDIESGNTLFGRFWCYSLAEKRDEEQKKETQHFWIESGGCMHYMTPICCELANISSEEEAREWEQENFKS